MSVCIYRLSLTALSRSVDPPPASAARVHSQSACARAASGATNRASHPWLQVLSCSGAQLIQMSDGQNATQTTTVT